MSGGKKFERGFNLVLLTIIFAVVWTAIILLLTAYAYAYDNHHKHKNGDVITGATAEFYKTWKRPDVPHSSCCSMNDCYATQVRRLAGKVQALHRETQEWIDVPESKIEQRRDSPDGQNHLCATKQKYVFCFAFGAGI